MWLVYCDETNLEEREGDFLIYGGLLVDADRAGDLSSAMDALRARLGVPREYHLKFNPGPTGFSHGQFLELKECVLKLVHEYGGALVAYVVLHDLASGPDVARRHGINTVCYHFDCILSRSKESGLVLVDRFTDAGGKIDGHLREKFTTGVTNMPFSRELRLSNIVGFHYSAIGQSHFPSIVDVALGSLRLAINAHTRAETGKLATAQKLISVLAPLFWRSQAAGPVPELGFMFSPKAVRVPAYREKYLSLQRFLADCGLPTAQVLEA